MQTLSTRNRPKIENGLILSLRLCNLGGGSVVVDMLFIVTPILGFCNCYMFCCTFLYVPSSFAIILMGKRALVALLSLSSWLQTVKSLTSSSENVDVIDDEPTTGSEIIYYFHAHLNRALNISSS